MANINDQNNPGNMPDNPQLSPCERAVAVAIILGAMLMALLTIIACWPMSLTTSKNDTYYFRPFHVRPANQTGTTDSVSVARSSELQKKAVVLGAEIVKLSEATDTASKRKLVSDKKELAEINNKIKAIAKLPVVAENKPAADHSWTIELSNLILLLVAACGFLGNLIHVGRSLTYFIGMQQFQRSWIPWYFIKPFTASGLALLVYFATNIGGEAIGKPINLFPIMLAAGLAGLFTDIATQKLKIIFEAILKPADTHPPGARTQTSGKVATIHLDKITPDEINPTVANSIKIPGQNLDHNTIAITINDQPIKQPVVTNSLISFDYQPQGAEAAKDKFILKVTDPSANLNAQKTWKTVQLQHPVEPNV